MTDASLPSALPYRKTLRNNQAGRALVTQALLASPFKIQRDAATGQITLYDDSWERVRFWVMDELNVRIIKRHFDDVAANLPV